MLTKIEKIEEFIKQWQDTHEQEKKLATLYNGLAKTKDVSFYGEFQVNGEKFVLHELMNSTKKELADTMDEELLSILTFLQMGNQTKRTNLMESLMFLNSPEPAPTPPAVREATSIELSDPSNKTFEEIIDNAIKLVEQPIINAYELYDAWFMNNSEQYTVGDVHEYLRRLVAMGELSTLHYITCYKCNNFKKHFTTVPKDIKCTNCGEDIVNIEIQYQKNIN